MSFASAKSSSSPQDLETLSKLSLEEEIEAKHRKSLDRKMESEKPPKTVKPTKSPENIPRKMEAPKSKLKTTAAVNSLKIGEVATKAGMAVPKTGTAVQEKGKEKSKVDQEKGDATPDTDMYLWVPKSPVILTKPRLGKPEDFDSD